MKKPSMATCCKAIAIASVALFTSGCGDLNATVSGVVKLDGEVLRCEHNRRGTVVFGPVAGGASATGIIDDNGRYSVRTGSNAGVKPGDYVVGVRVLEIVPHEDGVSAPSGEPITPVLYSNPLTSGLITTLKSGSNTFDIELDSSAGPLQAPPPPITEESVGDVEEESGTGVDSDMEEEASDENSAEPTADSESEPSAEQTDKEGARDQTSDTNQSTVDTERVEE